VNEGLHYCPVDENRFTQQNDMPKNVTKYKPEIVHAFGKQQVADCEQQPLYKNVKGQGWVVTD